MAKTKSRKINKNDKRHKKEADSESDQYDAEFDSKNPFETDEIESFHEKSDKAILDRLGGKKKKEFQYSSEEEVLGFGGEASSDDEYDEKVYGSGNEDEEDDEDDDDEQDNNENDFDEYAHSWGQKKSAYYSGNKIKNDEDAELEEEEARVLQERMMKQLDTNDFDLDAFKINKTNLLKTSEEINSKKLALSALGDLEGDLSEENLQRVAKNLEKMSKKEKLDFLQQESPELFELVSDFKEKITELKDMLIPLFRCIKNGQIPYSNACEFIINKTKLYVMYGCHLCFYFILKSQRQSIESHPIVKNILQFRNLIKQISSVDKQLEKEVKFIVSTLKTNKQISFVKSTKVVKKVSFKVARPAFKAKSIEDDTESEMEQEETEEKVEEETKEVNKRAINYQIEKNKGLTPKRNKMYRNPRVKNRIKAHKAIIKRKSIVPKVRPQDTRYSGEATGIRTSVVRAVKIK